MNAIFIVAGKELRDTLRNRWALAITLIFAVLALGISYFGAAASGTVGFTSLATTVVSLASLAIFLIPLIALLIAYDSIIGEEERGTLLLLMAYPLSRSQLLLGKFFGHGLVLALSTAVGFGLSGLLIGVLSHEAGNWALYRAFGFFILSASLLGWVFIAIAYLISTSVSEKAHAAGLALLVWFLFVLVFDLALLGMLVATKGAIGRGLFSYLLLLNPPDVFRLANLAGFPAARTASGLAAIAPAGLLHPGRLSAVLVVWVVVPLSLAVWRFNRRKI